MTENQLMGLKKFEQLNPKGAKRIKSLLADTAPGIYHQILEIAFADLYQRDNLDSKIRQTVSMIALATSYREFELRIHIEIALTLGFTKEELVEVFSQLVPFTGFPSAMLGIRLLKEITADGSIEVQASEC
jgi:4-carboxymuconolactone decarboxylase